MGTRSGLTLSADSAERAHATSLAHLTCIIPFADDSDQRCHNLRAVVRYLRELGCGVRVAESGRRQRARELLGIDGRGCSFYFHKDDEPLFHRTRVINLAARDISSTLIALWDTDIVIPYVQLACCVERLLTRGCDLGFPFDGRCVDFADHARDACLSPAMQEVADATSPPRVEEHERTVTVLTGSGARLTGHAVTRVCVGGAVLFRRDVFMAGGMENQVFVSYGPEDQERYARFRKLGFVATRVDGLLYHLAHPRGVNSDDGHSLTDVNWAEFRRVSRLSRARLRAEVAKWPWTRSGALIEVARPHGAGRRYSP